MEIMSRAVARKRGLPKYYTGDICKNGHISYRYTASGTCAQCVNGDRKHINPDEAIARAELLEKTQEVKRILAEFVEVKVPVMPVDYKAVRQMVHAFAMMRHPTLELHQIWLGGPTHGVLYKMLMHPDDVSAFRDTVNSMYTKSANFDQNEIMRRAKQFDPPPLPPVTIDDIAK